MGTTLANGVYVPDTGDSATLQTMLGTVANSFSDALGGLGSGKRQPRQYRVADLTALNGLAALTTLATGDRTYRESDKTWHRWNGTAWVLARTEEGVAWTMPLGGATGLDVGEWNSFLRYWLEDDVCLIRGTAVCLTSGAVSGPMMLELPFVMDNVGAAHNVIGTVSVRDNSVSAIYQGIAVVTNTALPGGALLYFDTGAGGGALTRGNAGSPFTWAVDDSLSFDLSYKRVMA